MSDMFADREKGYEAKWVHDADMRFKILARRTELLGLWAAGELGLSGAEADAYAKDLVKLAVVAKKDGLDVATAKIRRDFQAGKIALAEDVLHRKIMLFAETASAELEKGA